MTALCGGGSSAPKSGVAEAIIFTTSGLASLLNNRGGLWATIAAPLLGVLAYDATGLCGSDPPAQPTITAAEYTALLELAPWDTLTAALGKLRDLATIAIWHEVCECTGATTPPAPADLWAPPAVTLPTFGSGSCPQPRLRTICGVAGASPVVYNQRNCITARVFPGLPLYQGVADTNAEALDLIRIDPSWATMWTHVDYVAGAPGVAAGYQIDVWAYNASRARVALVGAAHGDDVTHHDDDPNTAPRTIDHAAWSYLAVLASHGSSAQEDGTVDLAIDFACTGQAAATPCCPPDPAVTALLQHLVQLVTQQQRWRLPFGLVDGPSHPVTLVGSFAVSRAVGIRVQVTAEPAAARTSFGNPTYTFDLGWISVSDGEGMLQELRITRDSQNWFPAQMQLATIVGYALQPGVSVTVTELAIEP